MKAIRISAIAATLFVSSTTLHAAEEGVLATVNGSTVTQQQVMSYAQARQQQGQSLPPRMLLEELINRELITQNATQQGLNKDKEFLAALEEQNANLLAAYAIQKTIQAGGEITEKTLRAEYDKYAASLSETEYRASHILLENKADAEAVISELNSGKEFAKLAEEKSTGPSAPEGGSLGWFRPEQMVEPFADALIQLKTGEYSSEPVETQFGWHVILLQETRKLPAPSFESMQEQLQNNIINNRVQNYIMGLRETAKIEMSQAQ